jgi:hypothetical protein
MVASPRIFFSRTVESAERLRARGLSTLAFALVVLLVPALAGAESLSWKKMVERREFWPHECRVLKTMQFVNGPAVEPGQSVSVLEVQLKEISVVTTDGSASFRIDPDQTDLLETANRDWKKMTPAQRELTYGVVFQRHDLWPARLTIMAPVLLGKEERAMAGEQVKLLGFDGTKFIVLLERSNKRFQVEPFQTDLLAQAREFLAGKPNSSPFGAN